MQVELEPEQGEPGGNVVDILKLVCGLLLLLGVSALAVWSCASGEIPRIRAVRENPDDESEWSVVRSAPEGVDVKDEDKDDDRVGLKEGLRNRASRTGCGSRSLAVPAPLVPSGSSAARDGRDEDRRLDGSSTSEIGCGSGSLAVPAPLVPSGSPGDDTSRRKQVRGAGSSGAEDYRCAHYYCLLRTAVVAGWLKTLLPLRQSVLSVRLCCVSSFDESTTAARANLITFVGCLPLPLSGSTG